MFFMDASSFLRAIGIFCTLVAPLFFLIASVYRPEVLGFLYSFLIFTYDAVLSIFIELHNLLIDVADILMRK